MDQSDDEFFSPIYIYAKKSLGPYRTQGEWRRQKIAMKGKKKNE
jgi:hypothetical protein